jgi:[glutamine synthetase] adenylyltransferase / [glutamine synthetase]-adenylyl-L-tyrosine phosphorylase
MNKIWNQAIKASPDPERAGHFLKLLTAGSGSDFLNAASAEQARVVCALLSGSNAAGTGLVQHPDRLRLLEPEALRYPRRKQGLLQEVEPWFQPRLVANDYAAALNGLREFKERQMLRIAARDLSRLGNAPEVIREISDVADVCLSGVWQVCFQQLSAKFGLPYHQDPTGRWLVTSGCVLGLGKLGGQELNYSSDVDVIFAYSEEGNVYKQAPPTAATRGKTQASSSLKPLLTNHQFFNRLAESFIAELTRVAPEGTLYRIDLRLRPEGDTGPLSRSLGSYENYYAQWGQTWERMMLIKARGVAGDNTLAAEFLEMIQPFRYPRSTNQNVLNEVGAMKDRIENEVVKTGELERNVKLGRGGIREIEFIAQSLQLLHAGRQPFLQGAQTLATLAKLAQYELLPSDASRILHSAYEFLRDVEHRLQMEDNRQTHSIPTERKSQERLARLMGFTDLKPFTTARERHTAQVRRLFDEVLRAEVPVAPGERTLPQEFESHEAEWKQILAARSFKDVDKAYRVLREFVEGPGYVHVSPRTRDLGLRLLPKLFAMCRATGEGSGLMVAGSRVKAETPPRSVRAREKKSGRDLQEEERSDPVLSDPDRVVTRLDGFISAYGARATLFELWHSNPAIFELLILLFDRSEFLAELAIRTPDLVDELVVSGRLRVRKTAEETLRDLRHGFHDPDQHLWLRRYHQAELMRIGLRDILGLADFEQYLAELSALADACLQYALEVVLRKHRLKSPPFAVIGLGKLGGAEIDYGSDLDIVFVADPKAKNLKKLASVAREMMELVSSRTEHGLLFQTDARLRPDGEKGLLVNTLVAYEEYYRQRAHLWEIQTLTRTRPVAGNLGIGVRFQKLAAELTDFRGKPLRLVAYTPVWKRKIHEMRLRIQQERTPLGQDELAIKTGTGGLIDAEFVAQALCLEHGWQEANTLRALERGRAAGVLPLADTLIENYRRLRRLEGILRRWSYEGETVLPTDPAPYYRVSVRCGFESPETFRNALAGWRRAIREAYLKVFAE